MGRRLQTVLCPVQKCGYRPPFNLTWEDDLEEAKTSRLRAAENHCTKSMSATATRAPQP